MASKPVSKNTFSVKEFDELENLAEDIFGGEACGMLCSGVALEYKTIYQIFFYVPCCQKYLVINDIRFLSSQNMSK